MKICFSVGTLNGGGIGQNAINISHDLLGEGIEVDFFVFNSKPEGRDFTIPDGARLFHGKNSALKSIYKLSEYMKHESPDVVFSARPYVNITNAIAKLISGTNSKLVSSYRTHHSSQEHSDSLMQKAAEKLDILVAKYLVDGKIAVSKGVAEDIEKRYELEKNSIEVIYNPAWSAIQEAKLVEPASLSVSSADKVIVSVGRLSKQKNIYLLLDAFRLVLGCVANVKLLIVGDGELRSELESYTSGLGIEKQVEFVGYVENPMPYMARADLFVLASDWEGFANVIVEALGAGTAVVSTNCPSGPSEILDDGKYGKLVDIGNVNQLAAAIVESLSEKCDSIMLRKRAQEFSSGICTDRFMKFLNKLD